MSSNSENPYGSSCWAKPSDLRRAGLFKPGGLFIGYCGKVPMFLPRAHHGTLIGPSGSGKGRSLIMEMHQRHEGGHLWTLDPKAEIVATVMVSALWRRAKLYCFNPCGLHPDFGVPQHSINVLAPLDPKSPRFDNDCKFVAEALIAKSNHAEADYFVTRARSVVARVLKALLEKFGKGNVSLPDLYGALAAMASGPDVWKPLYEQMTVSRFPDVQAIAREMLNKQFDAPKEFSAITGTIQQHMDYLSDEMLRRSLTGADFSFEDFATSTKPIEFFVCCPIEYVGIWAGLLRLLFAMTILCKTRSPDSLPLSMIVDEAGQLGHMEALTRVMSYMRGFGVQVTPVFQDVGQIIRHYGPTGPQAFIGNAGWTGILPPRDRDTAHMVSDMLGSETLKVRDELQRRAAKRSRQDAIRRFIDGDDPTAAAFDFAHFGQAMTHEKKMQRALMTPAETMGIGSGRMISFLPGPGAPPAYHHRYNYDSLRFLRGRWTSSPHHRPHDRVKLPGLLFDRWADIITERAPDHLVAQLPQLQSGYARYVRGYRPW